MRLSEFIVEASIMDKLKGAFQKKKAAPAPQNNPGAANTTDPAVNYDTPAYVRRGIPAPTTTPVVPATAPGAPRVRDRKAEAARAAAKKAAAAGTPVAPAAAPATKAPRVRDRKAEAARAAAKKAAAGTPAAAPSGGGAFGQMAGQLQARPSATSTTNAGGGAFGQMASQLQARPSATSTGGTTQQTATGQRNTASATNPNRLNQPGATPAAPAAAAAATSNPPPRAAMPPVSIEQQNFEKRIAGAIITSMKQINNPDLLQGIKAVLDDKIEKL